MSAGPKAILLLSGGLDSTLAGKLLLEMGAQVEAINFTSPFCRCSPKSMGCSAAKAAAEKLGIPVRVFSCTQDYLEVMKHPRFGRGSEMNACLDCRVYIFTRARQYMIETGADFVATGEVLGERPMSQRRDAMALIERESGLRGLIVRPLCGQLMPPSIPEQDGRVDRARLLAIQGRQRKPQMELAARLGVTDYPCPAGGCLLTDPEFAVRFRDLLEHEPDFGLHEANLLHWGRHFRLPGGAKAVVGREESENDAIERAAREGDAVLTPLDAPGPSVLCHPATREEDVHLAARLLATYMKTGSPFRVQVAGPATFILEGVDALPHEDAEALRIQRRDKTVAAARPGASGSEGDV